METVQYDKFSGLHLNVTDGVINADDVADLRGRRIDNVQSLHVRVGSDPYDVQVDVVYVDPVSFESKLVSLRREEVTMSLRLGIVADAFVSLPSGPVEEILPPPAPVSLPSFAIGIGEPGEETPAES